MMCKPDLFFLQVVANGKVPVTRLALRLESVAQKKKQRTAITVRECACVRMVWHVGCHSRMRMIHTLALPCDDAVTLALVPGSCL